MQLRNKAELLRRQLLRYSRIGLAFSGGADSSLLLKVAADTLGVKNVRVLHARSCLQTRAEQERAAAWPQRHGCLIKIVDIDPLAWTDFIVNPPNRCYLCKRHIYSRFIALLQEEGIDLLLDGTNVDDLQQGEEGRPGLRAIAELGVQTP